MVEQWFPGVCFFYFFFFVVAVVVVNNRFVLRSGDPLQRLIVDAPASSSSWFFLVGL
jgi:hypothetical protein